MIRLVFAMLPLALVLSFAFTAGCTSGAPEQLNVGPTGHLSDAARYEALKVPEQWRFQVIADTQIIVRRQLKNAKGAEFTEVPRYEAYYDKVQDVTSLTVFGNVDTRDEDRHIVKQGYQVVWQRPGNASTAKPRLDESSQTWTLDDAQVFDQRL